jgi:hypothetical protein
MLSMAITDQLQFLLNATLVQKQPMELGRQPSQGSSGILE